MKATGFAALLVWVLASNVLATGNATESGESDVYVGFGRTVSPELRAACEAAVNCEIVEDENGTRIQMKEGMDPGSEWYEKNVAPFDTVPDDDAIIVPRASPAMTKRQTPQHSTTISLNGRTINYGTFRPIDLLHTIYGPGGVYTPCKDVSCNFDWQAHKTEIVSSINDGTLSGTARKPRSIQYQAMGKFNGIKSRNYLIKSLKSVANKVPTVKNVKWETRYWNGWTWGPLESGSQTEYHHTDFFSIVKFNKPHGASNAAVVAFLDVLVKVEKEKTGNHACNFIDSLKTASGLYIPVDIFGPVKFLCN